MGGSVVGIIVFDWYSGNLKSEGEISIFIEIFYIEVGRVWGKY